MRKLILALAFVPALALSATPAPPGAAGAASAQARRDDLRQRHLRLARALGLAEALDLDEQGGLKLRATLARHDERRAPAERDVTEAVRTLRAAAAGDGAQAAQVDGAVQRLHDGRARLAQLDAELLAEVTSGVTPDRKARAALFLAHFRSRAQRGGVPAAGGYPPTHRPNRPPAAMAMPDRPSASSPSGTPPPPAGAAPTLAQPVPGGTPPAPPPAPPPPGPGDEGPELEDWFSGE